MLGQKEKAFKVHPGLTLNDLVPQNNFYRQVEAKLDLSFVRDLVRDHYSFRIGRPSVDPVVFFKLQLIMFFEGIRSERQLMGMVNMRLDCRWFIGYDLDESVPDHSSLSKIRDRYGLDIFQQFFEHIVQLCIDAGLVWGKELYFDATKVRANASVDSMIDRWYWEARKHLHTLFEPERPITEQPKANPRRLVDKYDGTRHTGRRTKTYQRTTDSKVSQTDPDASPMKHNNWSRARLGYHTHYVVDGGKARIILGVLVTPASIMENTPMLDMARWARFRWQLTPAIAVGDTTYGTIANIVGLEQDGIAAYLPTPNFSQRNEFYPAELFRYDPERDLFICPEGQALPLYKHSYSEQELVYRADARLCNACPVKSKCTDSRSGRYLRRSFFQEYLDRVKHYHETEAYKKAMRKRQVWVEPLFGEAKQWHRLRQFLLRGLEKVNIEGLMTAAGQNIKRLLSRKTWKPMPDPAGVTALPVFFSIFSG
jgi:transposase